jgi:hypothetical protein
MPTAYPAFFFCPLTCWMVFSQLRSSRSGLLPLLCVYFLQPMLAADLDFAFVFPGPCEIIGELHP